MEKLTAAVRPNQSQKLITCMRTLLQEELTKRCAQNPNYSLRSFAKALTISPAALSSILNNKRPITEKMKLRLGFKLGLTVEQLNKISAKTHGNSKGHHAAVASPEFQQVTIDVFNIISDPHHYALMELIKTHDFESNARWIAQRLKITQSEVNFALERLERVGLLHRDAKGSWQDSTDGFTSDLREGMTSEAQKKFLVRSLQNSIAAITTEDLSVRDNTSITMAINSSDLPKAKKMLKEFRRCFCKDLESSPKLDEVYQLTLSFIPVSNLKKSKRSES